MIKNNNNSKKGFTIIEVVLVLAIAGLIFLMVFIALPTLQRSQKDTRRKSDFARFLSQIQSYQSNNRDALPTNWVDFVDRYLKVDGDPFADPDGADYVVEAQECGSGPTVACTGAANSMTSFLENGHVLHVVTKATCDGEKAIGSTGNRKIAILYKLEGGGIYCGNN